MPPSVKLRTRNRREETKTEKHADKDNELTIQTQSKSAKTYEVNPDTEKLDRYEIEVNGKKCSYDQIYETFPDIRFEEPRNEDMWEVSIKENSSSANIKIRALKDQSFRVIIGRPKPILD